MKNLHLRLIELDMLLNNAPGDGFPLSVIIEKETEIYKLWRENEKETAKEWGVGD